MNDSPRNEDELHAYADGLLPADRVAAVEAHLAAHPEDAALVASWRAQASAIRDRWGPVADEPTPDRLRLDHIAFRVSGVRGKVAIAAAVSLLIGAAAGWVAREQTGDDGREIARALADAAIEAHRLYVAEVRHPIEVRADEAHLLPWLSRRVGSPVRAPDLSEEGLRLLGGRLLPGVPGPVALIMYEGSAGERVTVTSARTGREVDSAFTWRATGEVGALAWNAAGLAIVVAGPAQRDRLDRIARRVHAAYEMPVSRP